MPEIGGIAIINTGSVPSPLIDHISFVLDIDLVRNQNLPKSDEEVEACLAELRHMKNKIFESFVTDASRELFGRV